MKRFTVLWRQTAIDQLTEIWLAGADRAEINQAVETIDKLLSSEPLGEFTGELVEGLRSANVLPLRIIYTVEESDRIVDVATVRRIYLPAP